MPTDRHAATGTCEFGFGGNNLNAGRMQADSTSPRNIFMTRARDDGGPALGALTIG